MCGIFGIVSRSESGISIDSIKRFEKMMIRSERRGKDASGILVIDKHSINLQKSDKRGKKLVKSSQILKSIKNKDLLRSEDRAQVLMGHTRMSTHGDSSYSNIQPIVGFGERFILFHNGITVNWIDLAEQILHRIDETLSDTAIILECLEKIRNLEGSTEKALIKICGMLIGANNLVLIDSYENQIYMYTSNGSLFIEKNEKEIVFGSDQSIVIVGSKGKIQNEILQVPLNEVIRLPIIIDNRFANIAETNVQRRFNEDKELYLGNIPQGYEVGFDLEKDLQDLEQSIDYTKISKIKRCSRCIIPATYPGIVFDEDGVCSICKNYKKHLPLGEEELLKKIQESGGKILVPLSGGRDSAYALHFLHGLAKTKIVTYTYDWGFVTNLARENVSKICGKLGVEHILEAADLPKKRRNVAKNLRAWLAKPDAGLIPLLMAGDKEFLTKAEIIKDENGLGISIFAMNEFERTGFKSGFAGVNHAYDKKRFHGLSFSGRVRLLMYYGIGVLRNPRYLNSSITDTLIGFFSFYGVDTNYIQIYDYIEWNEDLVEKTLIHDYGWSEPVPGVSLWRTGDATSAFYNYLYLRYAGFSEFDTFRSNQIRAGVLSREKALELCFEENKVRISEIKTYLQTVRVSPAEVLTGLEGWGSFRK